MEGIVAVTPPLISLDLSFVCEPEKGGIGKEVDVFQGCICFEVFNSFRLSSDIRVVQKLWECKHLQNNKLFITDESVINLFYKSLHLKLIKHVIVQNEIL